MKINKHLSILLSLFIVFTISIRCYSQTNSNSEIDSIISAFKQITNIPQEKVYLHTDKPYYFQGDTIWIKGYLTSAITHRTNSFSKYLYIELFDRKDRLIKRKKIERNKDSFIAFLSIPSNTGEGDYYLRAYTKWMQNLPPIFLYTQNVQIYSSQVAFCHMDVQYEQFGSERSAIISLVHSDKTPYARHDVNCIIRSKKAGNKYVTKRTDSAGKVKLALPAIENDELFIDATLEDGILRHQQTFVVPRLKNYQVVFFPEGGDLISGKMQKVAFKAINSSGLSESIEGIVITDKGDTISTFMSGYAGMGMFLLPNQSNESYHVIVNNKDRIQKQYHLPKAATNKVALVLNGRDGKFRYQILKADGYKGIQPAYLIAHVRGKVILVEDISTKSSQGGIIDATSFPEGIVHFMLVDKKMIPLSERLAFVRRPNLNISVTNLNPVFMPRYPINLMINVTDENNVPVKGNFSLSVTDGYAVVQDTLTENCRSYMLLSSDLKGFVENPGYYFNSPNAQTDASLDILMLTQGWRRFDVDAILKREKLQYKFPIENGQYISGTVKNVLGKPIANSIVIAMAPMQRLSRYVNTDSKGHFTINGIRFPENTYFVVQAAKKSKLVNYELKIDEEIFPKAYNPYPYKFMESEHKEEYLEQLNEGYTVINGEKVYQLHEVNIIGTKSRYEDYAAYNWDEYKIERIKAKTVRELIKQMPGINTAPNGDLYFTSSGDHFRSEGEIRRPQDTNRPETFGMANRRLRPRIYLDNRQIQSADLDQIKADDIRFINLIDPEVDQTLSEAIFEDQGDDGQWNEALLEEEDEDKNIVSVRGRSLRDQLTMPATGRIMLTSKNGNLILKNMSNLRIANIMPLGYSRYIEFYSPKYTIEENLKKDEPDIRSTIYWNPIVELNGEKPQKVSFYASDRTEVYNYILEGITEDGRVCHAYGTIK